MEKAVFIDYKEGELDNKVFERIANHFDETTFVMRSDESIADVVENADAFFVKISTKVDKELINNAPDLKFIGVCSTAFDAIDAKYAREKGIDVCNLGGYSTEAVAEFFFAVLIEQVRELERAKNQARGKDYDFANFMGIELKDKVLGVIGAGKIGGRIAEIGLGIGMRVVYFDKEAKAGIERIGAEKKELDDVLSQSNFISLNLVLNKETNGIISEDKIALLKDGCVFVNLAPPHLINELAMIKAAERGRITFIFDHSDDSEFVEKFLETSNCLVYPPIAFRTKQANVNRWEAFAGNIERYVAGEPQNIVN